MCLSALYHPNSGRAPPASVHDRLSGKPARFCGFAAGPPARLVAGSSARTMIESGEPGAVGGGTRGDGPDLFKCRHPNVNLKKGDQMNRFADPDTLVCLASLPRGI